jgi:hypothetical protein
LFHFLFHFLRRCRANHVHGSFDFDFPGNYG